MTDDNSDLALAFPASVREDALRVASILPQPTMKTEPFSVSVGGEAVLIPYRIYHDPALIDRERLTPLQAELLDCLLTRHHSGFVRERYLKNVVCSNQEWIPPFVVQLVGEYVIEILDAISKNLDNLDSQLYRRFLTSNPNFLALTKQRVVSYWECYYRRQPKEHYAGFRIFKHFDRLVGNASPPQD
jgi:hypothetical protein